MLVDARVPIPSNVICKYCAEVYADLRLGLFRLRDWDEIMRAVRNLFSSYCLAKDKSSKVNDFIYGLNVLKLRSGDNYTNPQMDYEFKDKLRNESNYTVKLKLLRKAMADNRIEGLEEDE